MTGLRSELDRVLILHPLASALTFGRALPKTRVGRGRLICSHRGALLRKATGRLDYVRCLAGVGKATRAIEALRLADTGSISVGPMWVVRPARFNVGLGRLHRQGLLFPRLVPDTLGPKKWSTHIHHLAALAKLKKDGYGRSPGNLAIALRAFGAIYDRWPPVEICSC